MYQMTNEIPFVSAGKDGKLKIHEVLAMMMNCCQFQEYQEVGFCNFLRDNNLAVFLFSIQLDILRMPSFREKITTAVKIYGCKSIYGLRRITMRDEAGELCVISNATGAFFDLKAGKAVKLDPDSLPVKFDEAEPMEVLPRKIPIPSTEFIPGAEFTARPSYLDPNGHLNSSIYMQIAADVLPENFTFDRARVEYKKQIKCGETVYPALFAENSRIVVDLRAADSSSFASVEFTTIGK